MVLPYPPCKLHSKVIMEEQETAWLQITILWITLPEKENSRIITSRLPKRISDLFPKRCQEWYSSLKCSWSSTVIEQTWNIGNWEICSLPSTTTVFCTQLMPILLQCSKPRWAKWHLWAGQASVALATLRRTLPLHALLSARSPSP